MREQVMDPVPQCQDIVLHYGTIHQTSPKAAEYLFELAVCHRKQLLELADRTTTTGGQQAQTVPAPVLLLATTTTPLYTTTPTP
jgi:hypothetical protein